jgi:hypothetical protein
LIFVFLRVLHSSCLPLLNERPVGLWRWKASSGFRRPQTRQYFHSGDSRTNSAGLSCPQLGQCVDVIPYPSISSETLNISRQSRFPHSRTRYTTVASTSPLPLIPVIFFVLRRAIYTPRVRGRPETQDNSTLVPERARRLSWSFPAVRVRATCYAGVSSDSRHTWRQGDRTHGL